MGNNRGEYEQGSGETVVEMCRLGDGTEMPMGMAMFTAFNVQSMIAELDAVGALVAVMDVKGLAQGNQPGSTPFADTRSAMLRWGLCREDNKGGLVMHDEVAHVVNNMVHLNPRNTYDYVITDPREQFTGFED